MACTPTHLHADLSGGGSHDTMLSLPSCCLKQFAPAYSASTLKPDLLWLPEESCRSEPDDLTFEGTATEAGAIILEDDEAFWDLFHVENAPLGYAPQVNAPTFGHVALR